uniref:Uncharacterized protein n=1 Tax=Octopus bimaculoides TaxID=37653 RepID=A0A0L8GIT8_OCTBM
MWTLILFQILESPKTTDICHVLLRFQLSISKDLFE